VLVGGHQRRPAAVLLRIGVGAGEVARLEEAAAVIERVART
jgi:hypothetical protein